MTYTEILIDYNSAYKDIKNAAFRGYITYVYGLARPNGDVFYIGKGTRERLFSHEWQALDPESPYARNRRKLATIRKITESGERIRYVIYAFFTEEADALELEKTLISEIGIKELGGTLTNHTSGGESGNRTGEAAERHTEIIRKLTKTEEWRTKQREGVARKWANPERREKMLEDFREISSTDDFQAKKLEGIARRSSSPEWLKNNKAARARQIEANKPFREQCRNLRVEYNLNGWKLPPAMCSAERWKEELAKLQQHIEQLPN